MSVERRSAASSGGPTGSASLRLALLALLALVTAMTVGAGDAQPSEPPEPEPVVVLPNGAGPSQDPGLVPAEPTSGDPAPVEVDSGPTVPGEEPEAAAEVPPPRVEDEAPEEPEAPVEPADPAVVAENESSIWQVIWQVQQGCQSHCYGTRQSQGASQSSQTTQDASAVSDGETDSGNAVAVNRSSTVQFIWQTQIGCVAFCFDTVQSQSASQTAQTTQTATSLAELAAAAVNFAEMVQYVWQEQRSCQVECHGVSASQAQTQAHATSQSATAVGGAGTAETFFGSLAALARNFGATVQFVFQHQLADCQHHCVGGSQAQDAVQRAEVTQTARAQEGVEQPVAEPPPASEPAPVSEQSPEREQSSEVRPDAGHADPPAVAIVAGTDATDAMGDTGGGPRPAPGFTRGRDDRAGRFHRSPAGKGPSQPGEDWSRPAAGTPTADMPATAQEGRPATSRKRPASSTTATAVAALSPTRPGEPGPAESANASSIWRPVAGSLGGLMLLTAVPALRRSSRRRPEEK